ncbi:hypothetical protein A2U01_0073310 [Trifolium medium]|uniref:Uncharacterized protein n=1 Tax=Trifolium medium TaxID=97028 RepID=A0A392SW24_9FABA|nr:hypothetical protein [Trifolium medium]
MISSSNAFLHSGDLAALV